MDLAAVEASLRAHQGVAVAPPALFLEALKQFKWSLAGLIVTSKLLGDVDCELPGGNTPLVACAEIAGPPALTLLRTLLEAGANVNLAASGSQITPLMKAVSVGNAAMAKELIAAGAQVRELAAHCMGRTGMLRAVQRQFGHLALRRLAPRA